MPYAVEIAKQIIGKVPTFGICMGHQIMGQAFGADTFKLKFGHHGGNHPIRYSKNGDPPSVQLPLDHPLHQPLQIRKQRGDSGTSTAPPPSPPYFPFEQDQAGKPICTIQGAGISESHTSIPHPALQADLACRHAKAEAHNATVQEILR